MTPLQIQAELGEGHVNIVEAKEVVLTDHHLCLVMEYAAGNSLTGGRLWAVALCRRSFTALRPQ